MLRGLEIHKDGKGPEIMTSKKTPRMEKFESGQQEMKERISQATKMVINLTKGKRITDDLGEPTSWKGNLDPFNFILLVYGLGQYVF